MRCSDDISNHDRVIELDTGEDENNDDFGNDGENEDEEEEENEGDDDIPYDDEVQSPFKVSSNN